MPNYGDLQYWNKRYQKTDGETFDWLEDYQSLKQHISIALAHIPNPRILNIGCGNSIICENLYDDGYNNIVNIDISEVVITQMALRNQHRHLMQFQVMDVMDLKYDDESFDLVLDKSTLDAILCGNHSFVNAATMIYQTQRVLKTNGTYLLISYGEPNVRIVHLTREFLYFQIEINLIERQIDTLDGNQIVQQTLTHYVYSCVKQPTYNQGNAQKAFQQTMEQLYVDDVQHSESENEEEQEKDEYYIDIMQIIGVMVLE